MTDIVERLRQSGPQWTTKYSIDGNVIASQICAEAADEIERLRIENANLLEKLKHAFQAIGSG